MQPGRYARSSKSLALQTSNPGTELAPGGCDPKADKAERISRSWRVVLLDPEGQTDVTLVFDPDATIRSLRLGRRGSGDHHQSRDPGRGGRPGPGGLRERAPARA